ncbi:unnamed protein product [Vicia faba]|uniref:1-aminocyclopropane-1-carboxylate synthase n=1 Tax=Vicia faba TaxID=3906 RepID=A0AAV1AEZ0_VICFA|nr:unnamed protein product [Vicia faba]
MGSESYQLLSKIATNDQHGENSPYFDGWKAYERNPFHPTKNPHGVIQMGLAENQLCFDLIEEWIKNNSKASICTLEGMHKFREIANFQDYHGLPEFTSAMAKFMSKVRGGRVRFDPNRILMSGGATGANEMIMFCLADPGDAFLVPTPYYPGFVRDLCWRTKVQLIPVHCDSSNNFKITREALEVAYSKAKKDKMNVKATVFSSPTYVSVSEVIQEMKCNLDLIHIIYSLSKDLGFPGFRVGIVYSYNDQVVNCGRKMSSFGLVSSQTQHMLASMLCDEKFVDKFLLESSRRLSKRHEKFTKGLEEVKISRFPSNAGLFCWMNLKSLLKEETIEEELKLWHVIINEVKLNVSPGSSFNCFEVGWFRVCFANIDDETVEVALKRIRVFIGKETKKKVEQVKRWQPNLRLSFTSRRFDENVLSPHNHIILSPHSPLVRAT